MSVIGYQSVNLLFTWIGSPVCDGIFKRLLLRLRVYNYRLDGVFKKVLN